MTTDVEVRAISDRLDRIEAAVDQLRSAIEELVADENGGER